MFPYINFKSSLCYKYSNDLSLFTQIGFQISSSDMSKVWFKIAFLFTIIFAMEATHGVYLFYVYLFHVTCNIFSYILILKAYKIFFVGLSFSRIEIEKGGVVDSSQCFTNQDCIPFSPSLSCKGSNAICKDGACVCG